jgi:hypothetical protein
LEEVGGGLIDWRMIDGLYDIEKMTKDREVGGDLRDHHMMVERLHDHP